MAQASDSCQKFVGLWSWNAFSSKIDIKPDGTADVLCTLCDKNLRWTCSGNVFKLNCCVFGVDMNLSADGKQMTGARGAMVRLSAPPAPDTGSASAAIPSTPSGTAPSPHGAILVQAPLAVGTTPGQAAKLLEMPLNAVPRGIYTLDREYDFNVLDSVYYDAGSQQISLVGHHDERVKGPQIPYLQHLAILLENPAPKFTLNLTPESYRRANAFFNWSPSRQQADEFNKKLYDVLDPQGNVTANGRLILPSFGIYPVHGNKAPGYLGVDTQLTKDGLTAVTRVAPNSPAAEAGIVVGDWITFFDDGPIVSPSDRPVYHPLDLAHRVRFAGAGTKLNVTYQRGAQVFRKSIALAADSKDRWLGFTRYDALAALYRAAQDERAAIVIEAFGLLKDTPMGNPALGPTLGKFSAVLNFTPESSPEGRGQAISRRLDEVFAFPGNPVLAAYNASFAKTRDAAAAIHPALEKMDAALIPKARELLERPLNQPEGFQIPPEVVDRLWNIRAEMTPEYRGVPADSLLARAMFDGDYMTKRVTNRPDLKLRFPTYQTEFEYRRTHGLNKEDGAFRTWISVAKLDVAQSSSGDTLELRDVQMRFNIRKLGKDGIDLPNQQPNGYEDLLTSLYSGFAQEYPTLHELREIAKLTAAAAWLHGKTPSLRLPKDGAVKWRGPAKVPGLAYTYLYNRDRKLYYQMVVEGGVNLNLEPFLWPSTGIVDARGTPGGGAPARGAPVIPTSASVVDLRVAAGGNLTAPPDGYRSVGWVVRTNAIQGNRQSVSLRLNSISADAPQMPKSTPAVCEALKGQIAELQEAKLRAEMADRVYDIYAAKDAVAAPSLFKTCVSHTSDVPKRFALISGSVEEMRKLLPGADDATIHQLIDPAQSDYRVAVYRDEITKKLFVVFRGTQSKDDMGNADVPQVFGERTEYYSKAVALAGLLKQSPDVQEHGIEFIGHSLGGGLAAAAAVEACGPRLSSEPPRRWKCSAKTFNPAGVHRNTVNGKDLLSAEGYIDAYVVEGEPLNFSQDNRARTINGVTAISALAVPLTGGMSAMIPAWVATKTAENDTNPLPPSIGRRLTLPAWAAAPPPQMVGRHTMACVNEGLDRRISYVQSEYRSDCAPRRPGEVPPPPPVSFGTGAK
jgi:PDZ domain